MTVDFLDKALFFIKNHASFTETKDNIPEFTERENKLLVRAFYKLEKDGYAYSKETTPTIARTVITFYISFDGLLALENTPFFLKNKPYRWNANKQIINTIWTVTKIIAIFINAIIILIFTYLTYWEKS